MPNPHRRPELGVRTRSVGQRVSGTFMTSRSASFAVADSKTRRRSSPLRDRSRTRRRRRCEKPRMVGHSAGRSARQSATMSAGTSRVTSATGGAIAAPPRDCGRCPARDARGRRQLGWGRSLNMSVIRFDLFAALVGRAAANRPRPAKPSGCWAVALLAWTALR